MLDKTNQQFLTVAFLQGSELFEAFDTSVLIDTNSQIIPRRELSTCNIKA
jgi:hypothetical protein